MAARGSKTQTVSRAEPRPDSTTAESAGAAAETTRALPNRGAVVSVRGSVVDVRFDAHLPPIHSVLRTGADNEIVIEVLNHAVKPLSAS